MPRSCRPIEFLPSAFRDLTVESAFDVTPNLRRVRLVGDDLGAGMRDGCERAHFKSTGFDDHIRLVFPDFTGVAPFAGTMNEDGLTWGEGAIEASREYTIRALGEGYIDVDFVRHLEGRAGMWAYRCQPGDTITIAGPRGVKGLPDGVDWYLLIADETGLPAVARFLEEAPARMRVRAIVEVPTKDDQLTIDTAADAQVTWLVRGHTIAGYSQQLLHVLRELEFLPGRCFVWGGAEAMTLKPIRRFVRDEMGVPSEDIDIRGYWRRPGATDDD